MDQQETYTSVSVLFKDELDAAAFAHWFNKFGKQIFDKHSADTGLGNITFQPNFGNYSFTQE